MNKKQYNNIIKNTLKRVHTEDSLSAARAVFKNMGVALPVGDMKEVFETVKTDNYMGWKSCTMEEAQAAANNGTAAIGISDSKIVVLAADDAEEPIEPTAEVLAITDSTPAVAVAGLQYYSYGYGGTGCGGITTTISTEYCGGSNYRDVTKHKMVLQCDGYYVCSKCGYRVKSPELEDKNILSTDDYLKTIAAIHYYTQCKLLAEKKSQTSAYYNLQADNAQLFIDTIRSQKKYAYRYSYVDSLGKYHCNGTNSNTLSLIDVEDINLLNFGVYNGIYESISSAVVAYYCPQIATLSDVLKLVTGEMNALDFGAFVAGMYEDVSENMAKYSKTLTLASAILGMVTSGVSLKDRVVRINLDFRTSAHYIFDENNKIKAVRIFYP